MISARDININDMIYLIDDYVPEYNKYDKPIKYKEFTEFHDHNYYIIDIISHNKKTLNLFTSFNEAIKGIESRLLNSMDEIIDVKNRLNKLHEQINESKDDNKMLDVEETVLKGAFIEYKFEWKMFIYRNDDIGENNFILQIEDYNERPKIFKDYKTAFNVLKILIKKRLKYLKVCQLNKSIDSAKNNTELKNSINLILLINLIFTWGIYSYNKHKARDKI